MSSLPEWIKAIVELKPRIFFGIWLFGAIILLLPGSVVDWLGVTGIRSSYRGWIAIATIAAVVLWFVQLVPSVRGWLGQRRARREVLAAIDTLSSEEMVVLAYCLVSQRQTITLRVTDRDIAALVDKGLMAPAAEGSVLEFPYTVPGFVWRYMCKNPQRLLKGIKPDDPRLQRAFIALEERIGRYDHHYGLQ
jgi:hypothetical protein